MSGPRRPRPARLSCAALLLAALAAPGAARAADQPEVLRLRAELLASQGRCPDALPLLARARAAAPDDARIVDQIGRCQLQLERWEAAAESFAEARRLDPATPDVDLHLAVARFHAGDVAGAADALAEARRRGADSAEADLYEGLIALEQGSAPGVAAETLERAGRRDPVGVEPVASYYAGIAWLRAEQRARARDALERVRREAPGTAWAQAAERALAAGPGTRGLRDRRDLHAVQQAERPLGSMAGLHGPAGPWATVSAGIEYDSNVALRGDGVQLPSDISGKSDWRAVWTAQIGKELFRNRDWSLGILGAYYGSAHADLTDFDTEYPSLTLWGDRRLDERTTARLQYDFSYAWVGYDGYLMENVLTPALFHDFGRWGTTRLFAELSWEDYRFHPDDVPGGPPGGGPGSSCAPLTSSCGPFGLDERDARDRDGLWARIGFDHSFPVDAIDSQLTVGYRFHDYDAEGREYSFLGHEVKLGSHTLLPWRLALDLEGRVIFRDYRHPSTFPDPGRVNAGVEYDLPDSDKHETQYEGDAILSRPINEWLIGSLRFAYQNVHSNVDVFEYDRAIVGAYLTVRYPP